MSNIQKKIFALIVLMVGASSFLLGLTLALQYRSTLFGIGAFCIAMFVNLYLLSEPKQSKSQI